MDRCCPEIRTRGERIPSTQAGQTRGSGTTSKSGTDWDVLGHRGLGRQIGSTDPHVQGGGGRNSACVAGPSRKIAESLVHLPVQAGTDFCSGRCEGFSSGGEVPQQRLCRFPHIPVGTTRRECRRMRSGVRTLCNYEIDRLGGRFLDGKSTYNDQEVLLHVV